MMLIYRYIYIPAAWNAFHFLGDAWISRPRLDSLERLKTLLQDLCMWHLMTKGSFRIKLVNVYRQGIFYIHLMWG